MSEASIYEAAKTFVPVVNAASNILRERFAVVVANQTVFNLTQFVYTPNTSTLFVYINGVLQFVGLDYLETGSDTFTLNVGLDIGDTVTALAFGINSTANANLGTYVSKAELALTTSAFLGGNLIGVYDSAPGYIGTTLDFRLAKQTSSLYKFLSAAQIADSRLDTPVLDCTVGFQNWLATLGKGKPIYAPAGKFRHTTLVNLPGIDLLKIYGEGRQQTRFIYAGANLTSDIWTLGDGVTSITSLDLQGFNIDSEVVRTAGHGLHIKKAVSGNVVNNVSFGQLNTTKKLYHGIRFTNCNVSQYIGWEINVQAESIIVVGDVAADSGSDLFVDDGTTVGGTVGLHQGGGFGGLYVGTCNFYGQTDSNYKQDNAIVARANRETILLSTAVFDGANGQCIHVNETVGTNAIIVCDAFVTGAGFFSATPGDGIYIQSMPVGRFTLGSGQNKAHRRHALRIEDATTMVVSTEKSFITDNTGWGAFSSIALSLVSLESTFKYNGSGDIHPNIRNWIVGNLTFSSGGGAVPVCTQSFRYRKKGSTISGTGTTQITNVNGATGAFLIFIPFAVRGNYAISVIEDTASGQTMQGRLYDGTNGIIILTGANASPIALNAKFTFSFTVEV
jgi:hypothetical protein